MATGSGWPPNFVQPFCHYSGMPSPAPLQHPGGYNMLHQPGIPYMTPYPVFYTPPTYSPYYPYATLKDHQRVSESSSDSSDSEHSENDHHKKRRKYKKRQQMFPQTFPYVFYPPTFGGVPPPPHVCQPPPSMLFQCTYRNAKSIIDSDSSDEEEINRPIVRKSRLFWKKTNIDDKLPEGAIVGGKDTNGNTIYVGKTKYNGEELPVKVIPESHYAAVAYKEEEVYVEKYRVLCERKPYKWVKCKDGIVPSGAIPGGVSEDGEVLYIGRAPHVGSVTIGKVSASRGCVQIPFGNAVHSYIDFEVLVET